MIEPEEKIIPEEINLNDEDRQILLSLLREYTDKLNSISSQIEKSINSYSLSIFLFSFCIVVITLIGLETLLLFSLELIISLIISLGLIVFFVNKNYKNKEKMLKIQSKILAIKLEEIIRITSQFQEHIEKSYVRKIELDLRLADAESALAYCDMVIRATPLNFVKL